mmetsp:Transcript_29407/g.55051  ORF Transcript_29407/g.55051 Transcript_29407/m.55051 type:complete len:238 (+) Transcript_29407:292-1005(+)
MRYGAVVRARAELRPAPAHPLRSGVLPLIPEHHARVVQGNEFEFLHHLLEAWDLSDPSRGFLSIPAARAPGRRLLHQLVVVNPEQPCHLLGVPQHAERPAGDEQIHDIHQAKADARPLEIDEGSLDVLLGLLEEHVRRLTIPVHDARPHALPPAEIRVDALRLPRKARAEAPDPLVPGEQGRHLRHVVEFGHERFPHRLSLRNLRVAALVEGPVPSALPARFSRNTQHVRVAEAPAM